MSPRNLTTITLAAVVYWLLTPANMAVETTPLDSRTRDFSFDWKFTQGNPANAQQVDFNDSGWKDVNLPHDWSITGSLNRTNPDGSRIGYFPTGIGWYRKHFRLPPADESKEIFVQFDGVDEDSEVWINELSPPRQRKAGHPLCRGHEEIAVVIKP